MTNPRNRGDCRCAVCGHTAYYPVCGKCRRTADNNPGGRTAARVKAVEAEIESHLTGGTSAPKERV